MPAVLPPNRRPRRIRPVAVEACEARTLLSQVPALTAVLSPRSDPDHNGDVLAPRATVMGLAAPRARVLIDSNGDGRADRVARADADGFYVASVPLRTGPNTITASQGTGGSTATASLQAIRCDVVIDWNTTALNAVRIGRTNPPLAARNLAMVQTAVYDAVNSIDRRHEAYAGIQVKASPSASTAAAAAQAAHDVLVALYPGQKASLDATLAESLSTVHGRAPRERGADVGTQVAQAILALRAHDNATTTLNAPPATQPGQWQPTPPGFGPAVGLNFINVTPFAMTSPLQFLPGPPPALTSAQYAAAYNEVKAIGSTNSTVRTADQTQAAHFWSDLPGDTFTPPGHWNQIADDAAMQRRMSLPDEARMLAMLNIAEADAGISCWATKDVYDFWRPVTAIRQGDTDGNPDTTADPAWTPLWNTPSFPSYTSGHATFSAAAATVLGQFFGANTSFTDPGDRTQHLPARTFSGFDQAAQEAANSRLWGGIHFRFDNETGLAVGQQIGTYVLQTQLK